uniref:Histone H2A n=1 Tax=Steinernema glaseri TaxID=37863 RepID=A0A1I8ACZ1_9BILA
MILNMTQNGSEGGRHLHFDVDDMKQRLVDGTGKRVPNDVANYFSGVVQQLTIEVVKSAIGAAIEAGQREVTPRHVLLGVKLDEDLNKVFGSGVFSGGGVIPNINNALLMKPPRTASPLRVTHADDSTKLEPEEA